MNHVRHIANLLRLQADDRVLQFTSIAIDAALEEIFPTWARGAALVLRPQDVPAPEQLLRLVRDAQISVLSLPSSYWHSWVDALMTAPAERPPSLRIVFVGGERLLAEKLQRWKSLHWSSEIEWLSDYGPTEATISCTTFCSEPPCGQHTVPIGRPISNAVIYILDSNLKPVAAGARGELYIAGACLARGYRGRAGLTAEKFLPDPFAEGGARMYKTGDFGFTLPDGNVQFAGRADDQVKILGNRIELGEVEATIRECNGVRDAVVVAREDFEDTTRLIAYVVGANTTELAIRRRLSETLPAVMIPFRIILLERLPISPVTGKVDRSQLPMVPLQAVRSTGGATVLAQAVANLFHESLGCDSASLEEGFFSVGGSSLRALQVISVIARHRCQRDLLGVSRGSVCSSGLRAAARQRCTMSETDLIARLESRNALSVLRVPRSSRCVPASNAQERFWLLTGNTSALQRTRSHSRTGFMGTSP